MWLMQGQQFYENEQYSRAIEQLSRFLTEVREGPEVARALYLRGVSNAQLGHRSQAYADLRGCTVTRTDVEAVWRAYVVLSTLLFEDRQWGQAADNLRAAAERMPGNPPKDAVLYRLGLCYERTGRWRDATECFAKVADDFPASTYAEPARRRVQLRPAHYAIQCGAFRDESNARRLRVRLKQEGLDAHIREETRGRTALYVVLAGRYTGYEQAQSYLAMVKEQFVADAVLWP
jgi:tetratricopeptide (TPR) repeat protein